MTVYTYISNGYDSVKINGKIFGTELQIFRDPVRDSRMHKILSHLFIEDEWSLWVDGSVELKLTPEEILNKYKDRGDLIVSRHHSRNCIYKEASVILQNGMDRPEIVRDQIDQYQKEGYPDENGLYETGCLLRRNTREVNRFNEFWWAQLCRYSRRDQLSFAYSVWKTGLKVGLFDGNLHQSEDFTLHYHGPQTPPVV